MGDVVYVTTGRAYLPEIFDMVHELNPDVTVWHYCAKRYFEIDMPELEERKKQRRPYSGVAECDIENWIEESLAEEV